jgi:hypothetical protein
MIEFSTLEHKTNILPLRWFVNLCEIPAHYFLQNALEYDEFSSNKFLYKFYVKLSYIFYKPYLKWGSTYKIDMDAWKESIKKDPVLDKLGSDYDEDGVPYWEKYEERLKYMEENGI